MGLFRSSYIHEVNSEDVSNVGPGTANPQMLRRIWNLDAPARPPEKAPAFVETDIYRTASEEERQSRRRRRRSRKG